MLTRPEAARLASDAFGAWVEVLGRFRPHDDLTAALEDIADEDGDPTPIPAGRVPLSWLSKRRVAHACIEGRFADIGDPDTLRRLAQRLAEVLVRCGVRDRAAYGPSIDADDQASWQRWPAALWPWYCVSASVLLDLRLLRPLRRWACFWGSRRRHPRGGG